MNKYAVCVTQRCNLRCSYCYVEKKEADLPPEMALKIIDFIFAHASAGEVIHLGFFGGEPLLNFEMVKFFTEAVERHPQFSTGRVQLAVVTNGTIFSDEIAAFLNAHRITFCLSCDGPPPVQNTFRLFADGSGVGQCRVSPGNLPAPATRSGVFRIPRDDADLS